LPVRQSQRVPFSFKNKVASSAKRNHQSKRVSATTQISASMAHKQRKMDIAEAKKLLDKTKTFIFDCDGVIWKGDSLIDGVPETIDMLKSMGKQLFFITNNSTKSRAGYLKKFTSLGLNITAEKHLFLLFCGCRVPRIHQVRR
jgi:hypothetical protein